MKQSVFLLPIYIIFLFSSLLNLFLGQNGVISLENINNQNTDLEENIKNLESKQTLLRNRFELFKSNPESIIIEARGLGLYRRNDNVMYLNRKYGTAELPDAGKVLYIHNFEKINRNFIRVISLIIGFLTLILSVIIRKIKNDS